MEMFTRVLLIVFVLGFLTTVYSISAWIEKYNQELFHDMDKK